MEICSQTSSGGLDIKVSPSVSSEDSGTNSARHSIDKEAELPTCRVCHCAESDKAGDAALEYLGIISPSKESSKSNEDLIVNNYDNKVVKNVATDCNNLVKNGGKEHRLVEFRSPDGEIFICRAEIGTGSLYHHNTLVDLGCSCKNDLSSAHYACALKWFVNHGSTVCEICGSVAQNVRTSDIKRIFLSLRDYEALRERTASGEPCPARMLPDTGIDPDAVAAIRRQRLSEIALWFGAPHGIHHAVSRDPDTALHVVTDQPSNTVTEDVVPDENPTTKWAVEGTGIFLATGLLTVTLAWLIAPRVGKRTASSGLHILLGGVCALTVVVFFRFVVLTRIKYGPARYWAILFIFWFLVFGIWASRTREAHST